MNVPVVAVALAARVSVDVVPVVDTGVIVPVTPVGRPSMDSSTLGKSDAANVAVLPIVMFVVAVLFRNTVTVAGVRARLIGEGAVESLHP